MQILHRFINHYTTIQKYLFNNPIQPQILLVRSLAKSRSCLILAMFQLKCIYLSELEIGRGSISKKLGSFPPAYTIYIYIYSEPATILK